ncbi:MAG: hypothetical protein GX846_11000 [Deltaproteobacteria bacterium]|nr:hypothetical protein [Deltaproteobacteria bacterium]
MPGFTEILIIIAIILAIFILPKRLARKDEPVKKRTINKGSNLTGWQRMAILLSILWLSSAVLFLKPWIKDWYIFIYAGTLPVILYWGIYWIYCGFKNRRK